MSIIQSVIFDLGGVLLDIDYTKTVSAFERLGIANPEKEFSKEHQSKHFRDLEKGLVRTEEFVSYIRNLTGIEDPEAIIEAWCALLGSMNPSRFILLEELKARGIKLYILSNTNEIHQRRFESHIEQTYGWSRFSSLFEHIYYSHDLNMRKPDEEIFTAVLSMNNLSASTTLFIDDTLEHINSAKNLGIHTHHLLEKETLRDVITKRGLLD